ncbi:MAG: hypothetical protein WD648_11515 [Planctomycetaceae bacterium]
MSELTFGELDDLQERQGPAASIDRLIKSFRDDRDYHRLFDALLLKRRFEMGLSLVQPTSFDGVPEEQQEELEESYVDAAREVGELFLAEGNIPQAWLYFRTIREPERVTEALSTVDSRREASEQTEELINVALYQGANPVKGLELLLRTHGTCNTITALDQQIHQMSSEDRRLSAGLLVRELYTDLTHTVRREIEQKLTTGSDENSLRALITGRDWLFAEGNYHIDVSHLHSVVRFARFLPPGDRELSLAMELADYGAHLATQFQYPGDPPFENFYPAHARYFQVLADDGRDEAIASFRDKLNVETDPQNKQMIAYVLVDLLGRIDRLDEALELAAEHLRDVDESSGFSFARLCQQAGRLDALRDVARDKRDFVSYVAARLEDGHRTSASAK